MMTPPETVERVLKEYIGSLIIQLAQAQAEVMTLRELAKVSSGAEAGTP